MNSQKAFNMSEPEAVATLNKVFEGFKNHFNGHRISTELTMLEMLRKIHPDFNVTCITPKKFDLFGYAAAGHSTVKLDCDEDTMDASRTYKVKSKGKLSRADKMALFMGYEPSVQAVSPQAAIEGELSYQIRFGRWRYHWEDHEYIIYEIEYPESTRGMPIRLYFVLSPRLELSPQEVLPSPTDELLLAVGGWTTQLHDEIYVFDDGYWDKSRELWDSVQGASWDEVILDPTMKENLIQDIQGFFSNESLYKSLSVPWKRGVILHGVPGNGKTISIKALINTLNTLPVPIPSLYVKSFDACQGEKHSIQGIFNHARKMAPCLLIFEDLDSLVTDETRSYFLNEVDGLESNNGILMIGSTNHLSTLDPAISKRPSRFDRKYHFNIPSLASRIAYCEFWRKKLEGSDMVIWEEECNEIIGKLTEGFSFAYLKELFVVVLLTIARGVTGDVDIQEEEKEVVTNDSSEDGHVLISHSDIKAESGDSANTTEEEEEEEVEEDEEEGSETKTPKPKRVVPEIAIPEILKDSILLRIVRGQIKMLLDEMDNTEESEGEPENKKKKKQGNGAANLRKLRAMRNLMGC